MKLFYSRVNPFIITPFVNAQKARHPLPFADVLLQSKKRIMQRT